ncbi:hypothetical protein [Flagellimonas profundi]|uniref:Lipoprotein n=1 Tax=Flagellimonas profundi TaxID=2915620 RepID=A0ABS3FD26_9FLAO|nr:hypothetical protein [Allomuricauda profundi]MBO0341053.1 hypothetical protein [Allomuricauda profundi]
MNYRNLITYFIGIFILILNSSCFSNKPNRASKTESKTEQNFKNKSSVPFIENCENNQTDACFQNSISEIILNKANERNLVLEKDTLQIGIRVNENGTLTILDNITSNESLKKIVPEAISDLKNIEPGYLESQKRYISSGYKWFIIIENNELKNKLEY